MEIVYGILPNRCLEWVLGVPMTLALVGEHGPVNMDHLSTAQAAWAEACPGSPVEAAHFFTYLWALEGTEQGRELQRSLRISWEERLEGRSDRLRKMP